jgi:hypothetical protein
MRLKMLLSAGLLAAAVCVAQPARGGDTIRLNVPASVDAPTLSLDGKGPDADTVDVGGRGGFHGGGFHGGGFHGGGFHGGGFHHVGFHGGSFHHVGFHGFHGGFVHHGFYGRGFYGYGRSFYGYGRGFYGYWWPGYYSAYYYPTSLYYYGGYCAPTTYVVPISAQVGAPSLDLNTVPMQRVPETLGQPLDRRDPTYPYDGGPRQPVPLPGGLEPNQPSPPLEGRIGAASVQQTSTATAARYTYPAYGESLRGTSLATPTVNLKGDSTARLPR